MKFIHTADWHLGRLFHGVHLTDDQRHVLLQFVDLVKTEKPDAILIAGDIYDRAVPPPEAVELLDEVLSKLVIDLKVLVVVIAGNHDSPNRLHFGSRLFAERRLHVTGTLPRECNPVVIHDDGGPIHIYALPYAEPAFVRRCLEDEEVIDHGSAMRKLTDRLRSARTNGERRILMAHAFVSGGSASESERPLSVGGAGTVDSCCFKGFHYVALGHLHRPQQVGQEAVHYCGSLLKYSFDESEQTKGICIVEMDATGTCNMRMVPLSPRRDVRRIHGTMQELLQASTEGSAGGDYLEVTLTDEGPVLDAIGRLRKVYPNVMSIQRPALDQVRLSSDRPNVRGRSERELFQSFFTQVTASALTAEQEQAFIAIVDGMEREDSEGPT